MKVFSKKYPISQRIQIAISFAVRFSLVIAIATSFLEGRYMVIFVSSLTLLLTFLPAMIERNYKICLPLEIEIIIMLFIYAAIFLGEVHNYYTLFWWWDIVLHAASGVALGFAGFMMMYVLLYERKIKASPFVISLFSFSFALAMGALWKIFEFLMDSTFGTNMQKSGVVDTMVDLIVDAIGALFTSFLGYFYVKSEKKGIIFDRLVEKFVKNNPRLFQEK